MSNVAIRVKNVSKKYRLGETERYSTIRDSIMRAAAAPLRWVSDSRGNGANGKQAPKAITIAPAQIQGTSGL